MTPIFFGVAFAVSIAGAVTSSFFGRNGMAGLFCLAASAVVTVSVLALLA
jgi:hypothetical protein